MGNDSLVSVSLLLPAGRRGPQHGEDGDEKEEGDEDVDEGDDNDEKDGPDSPWTIEAVNSESDEKDEVDFVHLCIDSSANVLIVFIAHGVCANPTYYPPATLNEFGK